MTWISHKDTGLINLDYIWKIEIPRAGIRINLFFESGSEITIPFNSVEDRDRYYERLLCALDVQLF
jgi:hypothetical protein